MPAPRRHGAAAAAAAPQSSPAPPASATHAQKAESLAAAYHQQLQLDREIYRSIFHKRATASSSSTATLTATASAPPASPAEPTQPSTASLPLVAATHGRPAGPDKPQPISGLWWTAAFFIFLSHLVLLCMIITRYPLPSSAIAVATIIQAWLQLLGITAGYHRLWSHRSYAACTGLRLFLAVIGLQAFQGSGYWWAMRHRLHHRFTDTDNDPHSIRGGFLWAHMGWLFSPPPRFSKLVLVGAADLTGDWVLMWQKRWLLPMYIVWGLLWPAAVGWLLGGGGWRGVLDGVLYVGVVARIISWHCIWSINSVSHAYGTKDYSLRSTAVSTHSLVQLLQNGEGHHNLHHEFPRDYAHGRGVWEWDPTKWCIQLWCRLGWATELYVTDDAAIRAARIEVLLEKAQRLQTGEDDSNNSSSNTVRQQPTPLPPPPATLPRMSRSTFITLTTPPSSLPFLIFQQLVLDTSNFNTHPGGASLLRAYAGKDATAAMCGGINLHTEAAERMARGMAVARLVEDGDEDGNGDGGGGGGGGGLDEWVVRDGRNVLVESEEHAGPARGSVGKKSVTWDEEQKMIARE